MLICLTAVVCSLILTSWRPVEVHISEHQEIIDTALKDLAIKQAAGAKGPGVYLYTPPKGCPEAMSLSVDGLMVERDAQEEEPSAAVELSAPEFAPLRPADD